MKEYRIIKTDESGIGQIRAMAEIVFRQTYGEILSAEQMEYMMDWMYSEQSLKSQMDEGHVFYIAYEQDKPCGYMSIEPQGRLEDGARLFHLQKLYVMPSEQGQGLGRKLFGQAIDHAAQCCGGEKFRIELNVNRSNPAVGFYRHLGMEILRQGDFPIGDGFYMNDYIMGLEKF